jgi:RHS repeat-associated protein
VQSITSPSSNYVNDIQYNARGQMEGAPALTYGNNLVSQFSYDPNNFRTTGRTTSSNQQNMSYLYDHVGNVTSITDSLFTAGRSFTYDDLNRSLTASGPFGSNPPQSQQDCTYVYDSIGNMTNKCGAVLEYNHSMHPSAVSKNVATGKTYEYDDNGNMTRRDTQTLTWDVDNRLVKIQGGGTTVIEYDSVGQRLIKNGPTGITLFPFDGIEIASGVITKYIKIGGEVFAAKTATNQRFYHNDHLGGVNIITDTDINNLRCQSDEYEPWGSVSKEEGNCDPTHRFTGKELDPETGIYYYGGRYYDQEIGRFISPDPFVPSPDDPQNLNRYSYALNNPQRYTDPTGYEGEASNNYFLYGALVWQAYKFFSDLFSSHDKPRIVRPSKTAPNNQRRGDIKNDGRKELENVSVYVDDGSGDDYPGGGSAPPPAIEPYGIDRPASKGRCAETTALQRFLIPYQATAARLLNRAVGLGWGGSVSAGRLVGYAATYSYQTMVYPSGQVGVVETTSVFTGLLPNAVTTRQGTAGGYGGLQLSLSNATIPADQLGKALDVGVGGNIYRGAGGGIDAAFGTGTQGQIVWQGTLTLGLGGGEPAWTASRIVSTVTPLCPR